MGSFLKQGLSLAALSFCTLGAWNCSQDNATAAENRSEGRAQVFLKMNYAEAPKVDSLVIDCFGLDTLHFQEKAETKFLDLDLFPGNWNFTAKLYANGSLMQQGEVSAKLQAGENADLAIQMRALAGFIYIEIPLGFGNPAGISNGTLILESGDKKRTYPMEMSGANAVFKSDMLPLNKDYSIVLSLMDKDGKEIYRSEDSFHLDEDTPIPDLQIKSLRAKISLAVKIAKEVNLSVSATLPSSIRKPAAGDIVISEVFSAPSSSDTSQYEFVEIYNGSLDTLLLENCTLGLTSNASKGWAITTEKIAPTKTLVLGNVLSENTPESFRNTSSWASGSGLNNSNGSVVIQCNGSVIDSLYYKDAPDSLHLNVVPAVGNSKYGQSAQLNILEYESRKDSSAWCLGIPTPGKLSFCD